MSHEDPNDEFNGSRSGDGELDARSEHDEIEELRQRIQALQLDAEKHLRIWVRERPLLMLGAAVAAGFIIGRVLRRT